MIQVKVLFKNKIVKNVLWLSFDKIFRMFLGLVVGVWMARYLGPSELGKLNYLMAYVSIISAISTLGMDNFLVKDLVQRPHLVHEILGTGFLMRLFVVITCLLMPLIIFWSLNLTSEYYKIYLLLSLTVVLSPLDIIDIYYQSILKSKYTVLSKNLAYIIGAIFKIVLILFKKDIIYFALVIGVEALLAMIFLFYKYQIEKHNNIFIWKFAWEHATFLLKRCWPLMLSSLAVTLYMRVDQIMLGTLKGNNEVGQFSAAVKISEMFFFIPIAISSSYLPSLAKSHSEETPVEFRKKVQFFFNIIFACAIIIAIPISLFSNFVVHILYGTAFFNTSHILVIHVWSLIAVFLGVASSQYLILENIEKVAFYRTLIGVVVNVVLNYIFIPKLGALGSAYATLVSYFVATFFAILFFKKGRILFLLLCKSILSPVSLIQKTFSHE